MIWEAMTVHLDWPSDVVDHLIEEARQSGLSLDAYVLRTVLQQKASNASLGDEAVKRQAREEAGQSIRELRRSSILGSDLTILNLVEEGHRL